MKKNKNSGDFARIKSVIEGDRKNVSADVERMLAYDLNCVLGGYFQYSARPIVCITPEKGGLKIEISVLAARVRKSGAAALE